MDKNSTKYQKNIELNNFLIRQDPVDGDDGDEDGLKVQEYKQN